MSLIETNNQLSVVASVVSAVLILLLLFSPFTVSFAQEEGGTSTTTPETSIETGDATSALDTGNEVNTTSFDEFGTSTATTSPQGTHSTSSEQTATTSEIGFDTYESGDSDGVSTSTEEAIPVDNGTTTISTENDADIDQDLSSAATTGDNAASSTGGVSIDTGDAFASVNTINVANTTLINSHGLILLLNLLLGGTLDLSDDLWNIFDTDTETSSSCTLDHCPGSDLNVFSTSTATITNDVLVRAATGGNTATSSDGTASITTGDANASANVVNVANTNLIDSNYLLVSMHGFGDLLGDIVLPGADFFSTLFGGSSVGVGTTTIMNTNDASITNDVDVAADSGNNAASTTGSGGSITTGDSAAQTDVNNFVNQNMFGGGAVSLLFRVHGNWSGDVLGLPEGIEWAETPGGIQIYSTDAGAPGTTGSGALNVSASNTATIHNNVSVMALTGDNKISGAGGSIDTGDAHAAANVMNIANTNVVGRNWIFAIFNIMGDWDGNLTFGQPDLWIGATANARDHVSPGAEVTYTFTVQNRGSADARDVRLDLAYDRSLLRFSDGDTENGSSWHVGTIPAGETKKLTYSARVSNDLPSGDTPIPLRATVGGLGADADSSTNTEEITIVARHGVPVTGTRVSYTPDSDLRITKEQSMSTSTVPVAIDYTITVVNEGGPAYHAMLFDVLKDENGTVINEERWPLDQIAAGEEITVTYTIEFSTSTPIGLYTNTAQVKAVSRHPSLDPFYGVFGHSPEVGTTLTLQGSAAETDDEDLVAENSECLPYLTSYLGQGRENDPSDVRDLQTFLRDFGGYTYVDETGTFDTATERAVRAFQARYSDDILAPWGLTAPTGFVYYTTQQRINNLYCSMHDKEFALTDEQRREIGLARQGGGLLALASAHTRTPSTHQDDTQANNTDRTNSRTRTDGDEQAFALREQAIQEQEQQNLASVIRALNLFEGSQEGLFGKGLLGGAFNSLRSMFSWR